MKFKPTLFAATFAALATFGAQAQAQTQAPGLWEHSVKMTSQGGEMEKAQAQIQAQLAAMPPEQRKQIEDMMKSRGVTIGAQGTTAQFCLTKEQAAKPPEPRLTGNCTQTGVKRSGNTMSYAFSCTSPQQVSGEGQITFTSDKAYSGKSNLVVQLAGRPQQMTMDMTGKWLGAECGDVKPLGAMPAK